MFLRKLLVMVLPLLMCLVLCILFPFLSEQFPDLGFFLNVIKGLLLGAGLALLIPLMGGRRREPFAVLYWVPTGILFFVVLYQYLHQAGAANIEAINFLAPGSGQTVLVENAFLGFLLTSSIRAVR